MKFRSDFVTNSSSSSFILTIIINYDGGSIKFRKEGYFESRVIPNINCDVSPKQLGCAKNINELIKLINKGVYIERMDGKNTYNILDTSKIRQKISSMDKISSITISAEESTGWDHDYNRSFTYYPRTQEYFGEGTEEYLVNGNEYYAEGHGGSLYISDIDECDIEGKYDEHDKYDENDINNGCVIKNGVLNKYVGHDEKAAIPQGVSSIGNYAFFGCKSLTSITIPNSVTSISDSAFCDCKSLKSITIPDRHLKAVPA